MPHRFADRFTDCIEQAIALGLDSEGMRCMGVKSYTRTFLLNDVEIF